jgi:hypothetical protein
VYGARNIFRISMVAPEKSLGTATLIDISVETSTGAAAVDVLIVNEALGVDRS